MKPTNTPATKKRDSSNLIDIHEALECNMKAIDALGDMIGTSAFIDPDFGQGLYWIIDIWLERQKKLLDEMFREIERSA